MLLSMPGNLGKPFMNDLAMHVSKPKVSATMPIGEPFVVKSQELEHCGLKIMNVNWFFDSLKTEFISRTVD